MTDFEKQVETDWPCECGGTYVDGVIDPTQHDPKECPAYYRESIVALLKAAVANARREMVSWRPEVIAFADAMEAKLKKNDWKISWRKMSLQYLSMRLTQEREELRKAVESGKPDEVLAEAADVANFAMMIAEVHRAEAEKEKTG